MKNQDEFDYSLPILKKNFNWPSISAIICGSIFWICYFSLIGFLVIGLYNALK